MFLLSKGLCSFVERVVVFIGIGLMGSGGLRATYSVKLRSESISFVRRQWANVPDIYQPGFVFLAFLFYWNARLRFGRTLCRLAPAELNCLLMRWRTSRFVAFRDFIRFVEVLVVYAQVDHQDGD